MLKTATSLRLQCLLHVIGHLDEFPLHVLALLPSTVRKWLLLSLPVADVCIHERSPLSLGLDMEEIWRMHSTEMQAGLVQLEVQKEGFWRQRYLNQLWDLGMIEPHNNFGHHSYQHLHRAAGCQWHNIYHGLFALNAGSDLLDLSLDGRAAAEVYTPTPFGITCYRCLKCPPCVTLYIPRRHIKHMVKNQNLISLVTLFYKFCNFRPQIVTLSHHNTRHLISPLSQTILTQHPDTLSVPLFKVQLLTVLPLYFTDNTSTHNQVVNYNVLMNSLYKSLMSTLEEIDIRIMMSPFETLTLQQPFQNLRFLSISSLHQDVLKQSFTKYLIASHQSTLKVLSIKQCSFRSMTNLNNLSTLLTHPQFSTMTFYQTAFVVNTFQELLLNFVTSTTHTDQILSFMNILLEGNDSFNLPTKKMMPSTVMTKTLDIEDVRAAFYSIDELQKSLRKFPPVYLKRLNLKEMKSIEIISFLPSIKACEVCFSLSAGLTKSNLIILDKLLNTNTFQQVSFCIGKGFITSATTELIDEFTTCITGSKVQLKSLKFTWITDEGYVPHPHDDVGYMILFRHLLSTVVRRGKLEQLELDLSEHYVKSPSSCTVLYEEWKQSGDRVKLAKLLVGRDSDEDIDQWELASNVTVVSTTCVL